MKKTVGGSTRDDNRNIVRALLIARPSSILSVCSLVWSQLVLSERICARPFLTEKVASSELFRDKEDRFYAETIFNRSKRARGSNVHHLFFFNALFYQCTRDRDKLFIYRDATERNPLQ